MIFRKVYNWRYGICMDGEGIIKGETVANRSSRDAIDRLV